MARAYDMVVRMMKDPTKSVNAVLLPNWMAPKAVHRMASGQSAAFNELEQGNLPQRTVAGTGQLSRSLTREKKLAKGVALSRAKAHQIRPT